VNGASSAPIPTQDAQNQPRTDQQDKDDVFSDDEGDSGTSKSKRPHATAAVEATKSAVPASQSSTSSDRKVEGLTHEVEKVSLGKGDSSEVHSLNNSKSDSTTGAALEAPNTGGVSEFKAMAADASVFTFGDDEDYESE